MIVVDGNICAGKSTFCKRVKKYFPKYRVNIEPSFENPFLDEFYNDPKKICFEIENYLINQRIETYKKALNEIRLGKNVVLDRSIYSSLYFVELNYYYEKNLSYEQYIELISNILTFLKRVKKQPDLVIVLDCNPKECFSRISNRNAINENLECEDKIALEYMVNLDKCIKKWTPYIKTKCSNLKVIKWEEFDKGNNNKKFYKNLLIK